MHPFTLTTKIFSEFFWLLQNPSSLCLAFASNSHYRTAVLNSLDKPSEKLFLETGNVPLCVLTKATLHIVLIQLSPFSKERKKNLEKGDNGETGLHSVSLIHFVGRESPQKHNIMIGG